MMRIDLENHQYVDVILISPGVPFFDCPVRLEFGDYEKPDDVSVYTFSVGTDQLGSFIHFLQYNDKHVFFEFKSEVNMVDGTRTTFKFEEGGDTLVVIDKGETRTIPLCFGRIVLLEALKHYCAEVLKG